MARHAYLISAYDNLYVLTKTIQLLDDWRNDIYIHCDVKMGDLTEWIQDITKKVKSKIVFINRQNVYWGAYSYTDVILNLLQAATMWGGYKYYHLITGTSMPVKTQNEIHDFFDDKENNLLYFHINYDVEKVIQDRVKAYYPFINTPYFRKHKSIKVISLLIGKFQLAVGINRLKKSRLNPIYNGWGWFSIPEDFALYAISCRDEIRHTFNHTLAADEVWIHTIAMNSEFKDRVYGYNGKDDAIDASRHFQDWKRGKPYIFTSEDYNLLMNGNAFWARKFDENKDKKIIDMIFDTLWEKQNNEPGL